MKQKRGKTKERGSSRRLSRSAAATTVSKSPRRAPRPYEPQPELQLIYDTAPVGLAFLTPDCRYLQINERLTEICGISVAAHIGRTVRETVPRVADHVERIVETVVRTGQPITGIEVRGQRADQLNSDRVWITNWHPLKGPAGDIVGVNVVAEDVTERTRAAAVLAASERALHESETRFRDLADSISQFAWVADPTGWRYWFNKRWYDYTGTTPEEVEGWGWQKVHHPEHVDRVVERIRKSFESGAPWEDTFPLRGRDGAYRWFLSRALPIRNEDGVIVRWFGTNTDVTDQIEAEKALRELNETLEQRVQSEIRERLQIWNVSHDLLVVADLQGRYLSVNPAWTPTLGWLESDLLGKSSAWLLHPDDRDKTRDEIDRLAGGGRTVWFENRLRHKSGIYRVVSWKSVQDQGRIYAMGRDVTDLKDAENELRGARRELAHATRRATAAAMTAALAHELQQPISAIVTNANAALRWLNGAEPNLDETSSALKSIVKNGHRATEVVHSVRAMFSGTDQLSAPLDPNALIRDTIGLLRADLDAAGISLQLGLSASVPPVHGHRGQLQQVILNIITNAGDAMRTVSDRARVLRVVSGVIESKRILISLEDSGIGIDPRNVKRIFDPFFTTKMNGMGMGLAICRSVVEAHGGSLSVSPRVPNGSVFRIALPT
jgi:PAS domain S-box-containing protein